MGLTSLSAASCLASVLPNGADRWIGLLAVLPAADVEASEIAAAGYTRVAYSSWSNVASADAVIRYNIGTIELTELGASAIVRGWAVYDSPEAGELLAWGALQDSDGEPISLDLAAGDRPRFLESELSLRFTL